jgi:hypothetical protein
MIEEHEKLELGDLVECGKYGKGYICNPNAGGRMVKLTDQPPAKWNQRPETLPGWFVNHEDVHLILKKHNEHV